MPAISVLTVCDPAWLVWHWRRRATQAPSILMGPSGPSRCTEEGGSRSNEGGANS
jgi:hypothetical protein